MEIYSSHPWPSCALSNLAAHSFILDDVSIASMEGFLQSLKFDVPADQREVCLLTGVKAKNRGTVRREQWQANQTLWWKGQSLDRHGMAYEKLLDRAYAALCDQNEDFREALVATSSQVLTHTMGSSNPRETILTVTEFCSRLHALRAPLLINLDHQSVLIDDKTQKSIDSMKSKLSAAFSR